MFGSLTMMAQNLKQSLGINEGLGLDISAKMWDDAFSTPVSESEEHESSTLLQSCNNDIEAGIVSEELKATKRTYDNASEFWSNLFDPVNVFLLYFITFFTTFLLKLYRLILYIVYRAIIKGVFQITADYLLKPTLTFVFSNVLQPLLMFTQNTLKTIASSLEPLIELIGGLLRPVADLVRAFRLVDIKK